MIVQINYLLEAKADNVIARRYHSAIQGDSIEQGSKLDDVMSVSTPRKSHGFCANVTE